jgi:hypothetical protein
MSWWTRCVMLGGLVSTAAFAAARPPPSTPPAVTVTRQGPAFSAEYVLPQDAKAWVFEHSSRDMRKREPWRPKLWQVETRGVVLERRGRWDILRAENGGTVPRRLRIKINPDAVLLEADYPTLAFSDGAIALYSGAFDLFALPSLEAVDALPDDLNGYPVGTPTARIRWRDKTGPVLISGARLTNPQTQSDTLYAVFGSPPIKESPHLVTVSDPSLPGWISLSLEDTAPRVLDFYTTRLGPGQTSRPTVMLTWHGPTPQTRSLGGSVLPGLIVVTLEGDGLLNPVQSILNRERWFIAHESAHFWLGQTVRYATNRDSWITEGGADLMAIRAIKTIDPGFDDKSELQNEITICTNLAVKPVATAATRGEHKAFYGCGAVFALIAEASQRDATGGDWFDFLKPLIDEHRKDRILTRQAWLDRLAQVSGNPSLVRNIEMLLDTGSADPAETISTLLDAASIPYKMDNGKIVLE